MPPERSGTVAAVILAAGSSTRMGENKLFLRLEGETLLRRAVSRAAEAGLDPVIVVVGFERERSERELAGPSLPACRVVFNPDHLDGQHTSFRAGIGAVPREADAAVILLVDMPLVTAEMIEALVRRYRGTEAPLVISEYGGVHAPPTLYDRSLFSEILSMPGDGCGRQLVRRHRDEASAVAWPAERLADLDVPADLAHAR
jgi:molybdenum cofactor cytidylyltransferase